MKFIIDGMLGKTAKRLRILGFDAVFLPRADDGELLARARAEDRTLITRDRALAGRVRNTPVFIVNTDDTPDQTVRILDHFRLRAAVRPFSRCLRCNVPLWSLGKADAANLVPAFVLERFETFALCPSCGRVFWPGTHFRSMESSLRDLLGPGPFD